MSRPFLVVGAMKSGTTTLEEVLAVHPDVEIIAEKESTSFADEPDPRVMRAMTQSRKAAAGEVSTAYMQRPAIVVDATRCAASFEDTEPLHALAVLRDPYERAVSHWRHWAQLGRNRQGSPEELLCDPAGPYVAFSSYHRQLTPWVEACGRDRVLALRLEDYDRDPHAWATQVVSFLDLPKGVTPEMLDVHLNDAGTRVVARGLSAKVAASGIYRRVLRPVVPTRVRRAGAMALGGRRGGGATTFAASTEARFREVIAEDAQRLRAAWPHLDWTRE